MDSKVMPITTNAMPTVLKILDLPEEFVDPTAISQRPFVECLGDCFEMATKSSKANFSFGKLPLTDTFSHLEQIWAVLEVTNAEVFAVFKNTEKKLKDLSLASRENSLNSTPNQSVEEDEYFDVQQQEEDFDLIEDHEEIQSDGEPQNISNSSKDDDNQILEETVDRSQSENSSSNEDFDDLYEDSQHDPNETLKFADFFDADQEETELHPKKSLNLESDDEEEENTYNRALSTFEKQQKALEAQIEALEAENVAPVHQKPWTLAGEVNAKSRPLNSLLDVDVAFENASKPVPIITAQVNETLEDLIRARIKDELFDDVIRKNPPSHPDALQTEGTEDDLNFEKSKTSLADLYAADHRGEEGAKTGTNVSKSTLQIECEQLWISLVRKLDALSNFHFTPTAPTADEIVIGRRSLSSTPSIAVEEAIPMGISVASTLTPSEIYAPQTPLGPGEKGAKKRKFSSKPAPTRQKSAASKAKTQKEKLLKKLSKNPNVTVAPSRNSH